MAMQRHSCDVPVNLDSVLTTRFTLPPLVSFVAVLLVRQCIIMGIPIPLGTGLFKLLMNEDKVQPPPTPELLVE